LSFGETSFGETSFGALDSVSEVVPETGAIIQDLIEPLIEDLIEPLVKQREEKL